VPASTALEEGLTNIAFIQADTKQLIDVFKEGSVDEIWLTFPDPYPKDRQAKHRMTGQNFVKLYHKLLKPGGIFHFKTDDRQLFAWSLGELATDRLLELNFQTDSLHDEAGHDEAKILTFYEKRFLAEGLKTNYLRATKAK
jgi:tRNA (guanine-N7-)-methyltransferase